MILSRMSSRPLKEQSIPTLKNSSGLCKRILETGEVHFFSRQSKTSIKQSKRERRYVRDKYCCGYKHVFEVLEMSWNSFWPKGMNTDL